MRKATCLLLLAASFTAASASLAIDGALAGQDVDYAKLRAVLLQEDQLLD